jgi:hypothetical protein
VRLVSSGVATVDAVESRYGSLILKQSARVTLTLKREGSEWRILTLRLTNAWASAYPAGSARLITLEQPETK